MRSQRRFSWFQRITQRKAQPLAGDVAEPEGAQSGTEQLGLTGSALEQAYRDLLLENQVLAEANQRLHDRQVNHADEANAPPAAKQLIQAQRNALAERSRRMRELEYENTQLKREQKGLLDENRKLSSSLAQHMQEIQPLLRKEELARGQLVEAKAALRAKSNELARLTDKYYQLEARTRPQPPPTAANSDFLN